MKEIKSFVIRRGRMSERQKKGLELWAKYGVELNGELIDLAELFGNQNPVVLEIGFGMGHSLSQMAAENPGLNYLGVEVHEPGVGSLIMDLEEQGITNIKIVKDDAVRLLQEPISDESLAAVQIFFPDPWPKKKHHKRRLIQEPFLNLLAPKLSCDGYVHFATDWQNYAEHTDEVFADSSLYMDCEPDLADKIVSRRPKTKFEKRGLGLGHAISDQVFLKIK